MSKQPANLQSLVSVLEDARDYVSRVSERAHQDIVDDYSDWELLEDLERTVEQLTHGPCVHVPDEATTPRATLTIDLVSDAFGHFPAIELARILRSLADRVGPHDPHTIVLRDRYNDVVGLFAIQGGRL